MYLTPTWPAPKQIKAFTTLRAGGVSNAPYDSFNLADHVNDPRENVLQNRAILKKELELQNEPIWINQTHSSIVVEASPENRNCEADASFTGQPHHACIVLTADCLPLIITDKQGTQVAAIHAGWRGLLKGIIPATLEKLTADRKELLVWLGPAISPANYEVGHEVREAFVDADSETEFAFAPSPQKRWLADLYALARLSLIKSGVSSIYGGNYCTFADPSRFFSYRRDGQATGRMATLVWINAGDSLKVC